MEPAPSEEKVGSKHFHTPQYDEPGPQGQPTSDYDVLNVINITHWVDPTSERGQRNPGVMSKGSFSQLRMTDSQESLLTPP